ncbi:hypothetical protein Bbelb_201930 [Branchiostoma belcheri]|nr:hypothetical protein Bbelb_201930 [Branchiostoma belcheri]
MILCGVVVLAIFAPLGSLAQTCGGTLNKDSPTRNITSPNYPDRLGNGVTSSDPSLGRYCGDENGIYAPPDVIMSSSGSLLVHFYSGAYGALLAGQGFVTTFSFPDDVDHCASSPCTNGGTCVDRSTGFQCLCPPEYVGTQCQVSKSSCLLPLGMENGAIEDNQISASSEKSGYEAYMGRLNGPRAWQSAVANTNQWLQVKFNNRTIITGIQTQGLWGGHVKSYRLLYGDTEDGLSVYVETGSDSAKVFDANSDGPTVVSHDLDRSIIASIVRVNPQDFTPAFIRFRMELLGCEEPAPLVPTQPATSTPSTTTVQSTTVPTTQEITTVDVSTVPETTTTALTTPDRSTTKHTVATTSTTTETTLFPSTKSRTTEMPTTSLGQTTTDSTTAMPSTPLAMSTTITTPGETTHMVETPGTTVVPTPTIAATTTVTSTTPEVETTEPTTVLTPTTSAATTVSSTMPMIETTEITTTTVPTPTTAATTNAATTPMVETTEPTTTVPIPTTTAPTTSSTTPMVETTEPATTIVPTPTSPVTTITSTTLVIETTETAETTSPTPVVTTSTTQPPMAETSTKVTTVKPPLHTTTAEASTPTKTNKPLPAKTTNPNWRRQRKVPPSTLQRVKTVTRRSSQVTVEEAVTPRCSLLQAPQGE